VQKNHEKFDWIILLLESLNIRRPFPFLKLGSWFAHRSSFISYSFLFLPLYRQLNDVQQQEQPVVVAAVDGPPVVPETTSFNFTRMILPDYKLDRRPC